MQLLLSISWQNDETDVHVRNVSVGALIVGEGVIPFFEKMRMCDAVRTYVACGAPKIILKENRLSRFDWRNVKC